MTKKKGKRRFLLIGGGALLVLVGILAGFAVWAFGAPEFPTPTGPHRVGTLELSFIDSDRAEQLGSEPGGQREVGVRIWYPAADDARGQHLPTVDGRLGKAFSDVYGMSFGEEDGPPSASIVDAPPLAGTDRLPVVLFSHGGFAHRDQNLSTMQELASHGFIAVAIGHTYESILALLPDGRSVGMDPRLAKGMASFTQGDAATERDFVAALEKMQSAADRESGLAAARELGDIMTKMSEPLGHTPAELLEVRRGDVAFVLEQLARLDADSSHPLHGRYDLERVGVFGHSLGAHTALSACLDPTVQVRACVAYDVPYYLFDDRPVPDLERPVLIAYADSTAFPSGIAYSVAGSNRFLTRSASVDTLSVTIEGTTHMNFSDMNFMPRFLRLMGALGPIEGARASAIVNDLTVSFFRRYLSGEPQPWLDSPGQRYSEIR